MSDKNFDALWAKYNVAIARAQDLQEQLTTKQRQWDKREEDSKITEKLMRELCESILAKDPEEMVLGTDYSWSSIPINELIMKSKKVLVHYVESRKDLMRRIMDISEERRQTIESLNEQIVILKTNPNATSISVEELQEQIQKEKEVKAVVDAAPQTMKTAIEAGKVQIVTDNTDEEDPYANAAMERMAETNAMMQITPKSIPVAQNREGLERKKKRKEEAMKAHTINLAEYEAKMSPESWLILEILGTSGYSLHADIENAVLQRDPTITNSKLRLNIGVLANMGIFNRESISSPTKGKLFIYQLTDIGSRLFKDKFGKNPVPSEMDIIIAEHDNTNHGYGIKFVAEILREDGFYKDVCDKNRKKPIDLGNGSAYIPDIVCTDENDVKTYIEYECGNHTATNFNAKCNKMTKVTSVLNFIVPNRNAADHIVAQIKGWIENRGAKSLAHITIRVNTAGQIRGVDLSKNDNWKFVFEPSKNKEPKVNF